MIEPLTPSSALNAVYYRIKNIIMIEPFREMMVESSLLDPLPRRSQKTDKF